MTNEVHLARKVDESQRLTERCHETDAAAFLTLMMNSPVPKVSPPLRVMHRCSWFVMLGICAAACVLAGCSAQTNDRIWQKVDPLGHARATDAPFLYRGKDADAGGTMREHYLADP